MVDRISRRLRDILDALDQIDLLLGGRSYADLEDDRVARAAYERFLEIVSEASKHIPDDMKATAPHIPWRSIRDIGNRLRHAYRDVDHVLLWDIYAKNALADLRGAVESMLSQSGRR